MTKKLKVLEFGESMLRQKATAVKPSIIKSAEFKDLITEMEKFLSDKKLGVGLAAPQIGQDMSLAIILIQPTKHRTKVKEFRLTIINPKISATYGNRVQVWEGCISGGPAESGLYAKVPRYKKVKLEYTDESGGKRSHIFEGLIAQVIQHEVDHLNGILFVDRVRDSKSFVTYNQYRKLLKNGMKTGGLKASN